MADDEVLRRRASFCYTFPVHPGSHTKGKGLVVIAEVRDRLPEAMRPPEEKWQHMANLAEAVKMLAEYVPPEAREMIREKCDAAIDHIQSSEECEED